MKMKFARVVILCFLALLFASCSSKEAIPDKVVVLTFDDSPKSHITVVAPILKKYGFGATFFVTEKERKQL